MPKAILTGASSGVGYALACELADHGYDLGLMARRVGPLEELRKTLPVRVAVQSSDFLNPDKALQDFRALWNSMGGAELVILNAGVNHRNDALDWELDRAMIDVNIRAFVALADEACCHFLKNGGGHLVGVSSIAAVRGVGKAPVYGATKAFISNFLQGLRQRLTAECPEVTVTDIRPGYVNTAMIEHAPIKFWVASPEKVAGQIIEAIRKKKSAVYITHRWTWVAAVFWLLPERLVSWGYAKFARKKSS